MNWYEFADKDDIRAHRFYGDLVEAQGSANDHWTEGWVKVPRKVLHRMHRGVNDKDGTILWTGSEWVAVVDYERDGRLYARLALPGEFD